jgi:hypothetical protein
MNPDQVVKTIEVAFDVIERPTTSLRQFVLTDKFGMSREITDKEWYLAGKARVDTKWDEIPDSEIKECGSQLAHMSSEEFQYYLPAYMRYSVKHYQKPLLDDDILGSTVFALSPSSKDKPLYSYAISQYAQLNSTQKLAIIQFLKFVATKADYIEQPYAVEALDQYWENNFQT